MMRLPETTLQSGILMMATALLLVAALVRFGQVAAQLREVETQPDPQTIHVLAGCMLRSRSCRTAILALHVSLIAQSVALLACSVACELGWSSEPVSRVALAFAAIAALTALVMMLLEARGAVETLELMTRRRLNAGRTIN